MRELVIPGFLSAAGLVAQVQPAWTNSYQQAPERNHYLNDMEANTAGDVWLYGIANDTIDWATGMVVKYAQHGLVQEWTVEFMDIGQFTDIDIDDSNNVHVGTTTYDTIGDTRSNYLTKKISSDGQVLWSAVYTGIGPNNLDRAKALCVDAQGNTIITGFGDRPDYHFDWHTVKYDPMGNQLWVATHAPPTDFNGTDGGIDITTDGAGNIYVTGESHDTANGDFATIKYAPDGTELWLRREGGYTYSQGRVVRVIGDRVYVAGQFTYDGLDSTDVLIAAYDTAGTHLWTTMFNAPPSWTTDHVNGRETIEDLQVDAEGNVHITGTQFAGNGWRDDYMIVKLDADGDLLWHQYYGAGTNWDDPRAMLVDDVGNVYVTGRCDAAPEGYSPVHTVAYSASGEQIWYAPYTTGYWDGCHPGMVDWDHNDHMYVGASSNGQNGGQLFLLVYALPNAVPQTSATTALVLAPYTAGGRLDVDLSSLQGSVRLHVMDSGGRSVRDQWITGGSIQGLPVTDLPAGMYVLQVASGNRAAMARFVVGR